MSISHALLCFVEIAFLVVALAAITRGMKRMAAQMRELEKEEKKGVHEYAGSE